MKSPVFFAILVLAAFAARADYPDRPIHFVCPFAPGGGADAVARAVGLGISKALGQSVIIDNKPGGDASIASSFVMHAPPDGYTILFGSNTGMSAAPALHKNIDYDPAKDFTPISLIGYFPYFLVVNNDLPVKTLRDLVEYARAHPGQLNYASGNAMGIIATGQLVASQKLAMTHVPYKSEAPAMPDLLSNRVQMIFTTGFIVPHVKEGKVRAIVAALDSRNEALPDVPTVAEAGYPEIAIRGWAGVFAPAGLARDITAKLNAAVVESLRMPEVRALLAAQGFPPQGSTSAELAEFTKMQLQSWAAGARAAGITPD